VPPLLVPPVGMTLLPPDAINVLAGGAMRTLPSLFSEQPKSAPSMRLVNAAVGRAPIATSFVNLITHSSESAHARARTAATSLERFTIRALHVHARRGRSR
jgi:hypothetical protein